MTRLRELAAAIQPLKVEGSLDREVTGLAYDSRRVMPGMVFVALRGEHTDGHDYIESAIDRGAVAVICERHGSFSQRGTRLKVDDSRVALARASACFYQYPASKLRVIGVTGTNGKTTVAFMIKAVLEAHGLKCGLIGTVRYEVGDRVMPAQRTTPEALEVQQMMAQMVRSGCQVCVMEVSSHALDQKRVEGIGFIAKKLAALVPQARIGVGHGQMPAKALERVMHQFIHGEIDVLVSTTIVESGIDIPNANTLIVNRADAFGLSELYQLRGRVGRFNRSAYAYFFIPKGTVLSDEAKKRLDAIERFTYLGSGFNLAMEDLEIRGAGNILGVEQHGHIMNVGFDLYCRILRETIEELRRKSEVPEVSA